MEKKATTLRVELVEGDALDVTLALPMVTRREATEPPQACPVCGTEWRPWNGSTLPCHARCLLGAEQIAALRAYWRRYPTATIGRIAAALGMSEASTRAILDEKIATRPARRKPYTPRSAP